MPSTMRRIVASFNRPGRVPFETAARRLRPITRKEEIAWFRLNDLKLNRLSRSFVLIRMLADSGFKGVISTVTELPRWISQNPRFSRITAQNRCPTCHATVQATSRS